jgi:hypothetical protein
MAADHHVCGVVQMSEASASPLLVEVFLANGRIRGLTHEVHSRHRLVDVLGAASQSLALKSVQTRLGASMNAREFVTLNIEKRAIVAAIPHETKQQERERSVLTTTVGKSQTQPLHATLILPPFVAEGSIHVPFGFAGIGTKLTANPQIFGPFVPVTGARLTLPGGETLEAPVLLVNRDLIAAISVSEEKRPAAPVVANALPPRVEAFARRRDGD